MINLFVLGIGLASISTQRYTEKTINKHNENKDFDKRTENFGSDLHKDSAADENGSKEFLSNNEKNLEKLVSTKKNKHVSVKTKHHSKSKLSGFKRHKHKGKHAFFYE